MSTMAAAAAAVAVWCAGGGVAGGGQRRREAQRLSLIRRRALSTVCSTKETATTTSTTATATTTPRRTVLAVAAVTAAAAIALPIRPPTVCAQQQGSGSGLLPLISSQTQRLIDRLNTGDVDGFVGGYAADAVMVIGGKKYRGRKEIRGAIQGLVDKGFLPVQVRTLSVGELDTGRLIERGKYSGPTGAGSYSTTWQPANNNSSTKEWEILLDVLD